LGVKNSPAMKIKFIVALALCWCLLADAFAQKKEYKINSLRMIYDKDRLQRETGLSIGENKVVDHVCVSSIIIDEAAHSITGNIRFTCSECANPAFDKPINLTVDKAADGKYIVTSFHDKFHPRCDNCAVIVNESTGQVTFDFLYFYLLEQSTVFHIQPAYPNINAALAAADLGAEADFIKKGADLNASYSFEGKFETPLNFLCEMDPDKVPNKQMIRLLLDKQINVNQADPSGFTPLMKTLQAMLINPSLNVSVFDLIMTQNPDKHAKAGDGTTALKLAKKLDKKASFQTFRSILDEMVGRLK
jgi:hypothetical protein